MRTKTDSGSGRSWLTWRRGVVVGSVAALAAACGGGGGGGGGDGTDTMLSVPAVAERTAAGEAVRLGESVSTEGVVTVAAGIFANNKLKVFIQDGGMGIMVYHQAAADVETFAQGDRIEVTGVVRQEDPLPDNNLARGTILVDITDGDWNVVDTGQALPAPTERTLAAIGADDVGTLIRVTGLHKTEGDWPPAGSRSTEVRVSDDGGATVLTLRLQRNTITEALAAELRAIGDDGTFDVDAIVVQDDLDDDGTLLNGFELWIRGTGDIRAAG